MYFHLFSCINASSRISLCHTHITSNHRNHQINQSQFSFVTCFSTSVTNTLLSVEKHSFNSSWLKCWHSFTYPKIKPGLQIILHNQTFHSKIQVCWTEHLPHEPKPKPLFTSRVIKASFNNLLIRTFGPVKRDCWWAKRNGMTNL